MESKIPLTGAGYAVLNNDRTYITSAPGITMDDLGNWSFHVPPVCTAYWNDQDWVRYVLNCNLARVLAQYKES